MPTYEYHCQSCNKEFSKVMSMSAHEQGDVQCPACQATSVTQRYSTFMPKTSKKS